MLEPAQAKQIGAKVADSEQARELTERIKQVTRRRRLTTPPTSGPGGIDPNTIAEYLDNEVTAEKAAEVEQICLASDVHLAEVAACHQILTLVLGEPALVPPAAKQKMYALVKGPESIPFRKPTRSATKEIDQDLSSEIDPSQDETLSLGVQPRGKNDNRNLLLLIGGGALALVLLAVAIWQIVLPGGPGHGNQHANADAKDKDKDKDKADLAKIDGDKKLDVSKDKDKDKDEKKDLISKDKDDDKKQPENKGIEVVPVKIDPVPEVVAKAADNTQRPIGLYLAPNLKEPSALLVKIKSDKGNWARLAPAAPNKTDLNVSSGLPLMSLSGSSNKIILETGIELTLWGNLPEITQDYMLLESRAVVHATSQLDADLTLQRGRLVVKNVNKTKKAKVRLRFDNPTLDQEEHFDIGLDSGSSLVFDRFCELERDEPFYEDPKDPNRKGPTAIMQIYGTAGTASIRSGQVSYSIDETQQPILMWQSRQGVLKPPPPPPPPATMQSYLPPWLKGTPPAKTPEEQQTRKKAMAACDDFAKALASKSIDVALAEALDAAHAASLKEGGDKRMSPETFALWNHAIRSSSSVDDVAHLFEEFANDKTPAIARRLILSTLHQWLALQRDHDQELFKVVLDSSKKKRTVAVKVMELFHKVSEADARKPGTYQVLIEGLNNELMPIRALSQWHLYALAPAGGNIPYDPAIPRASREAAVRAWSQLIPPGQLPPTGAPMKKDKM